MEATLRLSGPEGRIFIPACRTPGPGIDPFGPSPEDAQALLVGPNAVAEVMTPRLPPRAAS